MGAFLAMLIAPLGARADSAVITVGNTFFSPDVSFLDAGTDVTFDWVQGEHRLRAYRGATWDSGLRASPATFQIPFTGGTVRYRCTIHSRIDASGSCLGMCGIITDDPDIDLTRPIVEVTAPRSGEVLVPVPVVDSGRRAIRFPVRIEGRALDDTIVEAVGVRWWDNAGRSFDVVADCDDCTEAASVSWFTEVSLLPGTYLVEASAADPSGNRAFSTPKRMFIVV